MPDILLTNIDVTHARNGRRELDRDHVSRLAAEIARLGLLHPITVRKTGARYELIAGNHRLEAFRFLGKETIPAIIRDDADDIAAELRLTENLQRNQLSPLEEAHQLQELLDLEPGGVDALARRLNRGPEWILDRIELAQYPPDFQDAIHARRISLAVAKHLVRIMPLEARNAYLKHAIEHGCSANTARLWVQEASRENAPPPDMSDFSSLGQTQAFTTTTHVKCFGCETQTDLNETENRRLCKSCLKAIEEAQRTTQRLPELTPSWAPTA